MPQKRNPTAKVRARYGIGEWYGKVFSGLPAEKRREYARNQFLSGGERRAQPCPFRSSGGTEVSCSKEGGVCSIRRYVLDRGTGAVEVAAGEDGRLVTTCPHRFKQGGAIFRWVGEKLLGTPAPMVVGEVPFLERRIAASGGQGSSERARKVGRIDNVLVHPKPSPLRWCPLEMQAVYFSGRGMKEEFRAADAQRSPGLPFPTTNRRPDFRSSGPKRLMPQLQTKVPTLRRWGKKMAVVIDKSFFEALGEMREVRDVSSCDIAWFVVRFDLQGHQSAISLDSVRYTTLESAVEGLTGGEPVSQKVFEETIRQKLTEAEMAS